MPDPNQIIAPVNIPDPIVIVAPVVMGSRGPKGDDGETPDVSGLMPKTGGTFTGVVSMGTNDLSIEGGSLTLIDTTINLLGTSNAALWGAIGLGGTVGNPEFASLKTNNITATGQLNITAPSYTLSDPAALRSAMGLGTAQSPTFAALTITGRLFPNTICPTGILYLGSYNNEYGGLQVRFGAEVWATGIFVVKGTTASTSTSTGAFQVVGGAGIAGSVNVGGDIIASGGITIGTGTKITRSAVYSKTDTTSIAAGAVYSMSITATGIVAGDVVSNLEMSAIQPDPIVVKSIRCATDAIIVDWLNTDLISSHSLTGATFKIRGFKS